MKIEDQNAIFGKQVHHAFSSAISVIEPSIIKISLISFSYKMPIIISFCRKKRIFQETGKAVRNSKISAYRTGQYQILFYVWEG
jgi:hypothetical protein